MAQRIRVLLTVIAALMILAAPAWAQAWAQPQSSVTSSTIGAPVWGAIIVGGLVFVAIVIVALSGAGRGPKPSIPVDHDASH